MKIKSFLILEIPYVLYIIIEVLNHNLDMIGWWPVAVAFYSTLNLVYICIFDLIAKSVPQRLYLAYNLILAVVLAFILTYLNTNDHMLLVYPTAIVIFYLYKKLIYLPR